MPGRDSAGDVYVLASKPEPCIYSHAKSVPLVVG